MSVKLSVGTRVYVSAAVPTVYEVVGVNGFDDLTWTEIGEVTSLGEFGGTAQITQHVPLATGIVAKRKGSIDYGTASMSIGRVTDAGQTLLKAGFDGADAYSVHSFKVVSAIDALIHTACFTGLIGSFTTVYNDANTVTGINCNVELDNKVVSAAV